MNKFFILILLFNIFSCEKEVVKRKASPTPSHSIPVAQPEKKVKPIDKITSNSKTTVDILLSTNYTLFWQIEKNRKIVLKNFEKSYEDGLNPADYNTAQLWEYEKKMGSLNDRQIEKYDALLTSSFQKYIAHLTNGRLNPRKLYRNWDLKENKVDINEIINKLIISDSLVEKIKLLKPQHLVYKRLKKALAIINELQNEKINSLKLKNIIVENDTNSSVIDIKKRLIYWKDLPPKDSLSAIYDSETVEAIKNFQIRHGLAADGVIGKLTIGSLNFSKKQRREQIIANLERWKWFPRAMGKEYLIINIPDYRLSLVKNGDTLRTHKVIVGRAKRRTPVLSSELAQVVFNPTWTVPPTILREDVIPAILKDRNYLAQNNIKLYDLNGNFVPASHWRLSNAKNYRYVQSPGTFNSLGMVKLTFPNRFSIYLHDTNHREFFTKSERSLSSGCVRVDSPLELTEYLLADATYWNLAKITETLQSEKTKMINIKKDVLIHILYWTAWSEKNTLIFRDDIYNLDADLYDSLGK
ncbi:MAG TPA: L,D-transpeptidase family protein [Flavobacterium sp.]|nr:L,D-transpeptidase family protein [Flavobacterium sp.]